MARIIILLLICASFPALAGKLYLSPSPSSEKEDDKPPSLYLRGGSSSPIFYETVPVVYKQRAAVERPIDKTTIAAKRKADLKRRVSIRTAERKARVAVLLEKRKAARAAKRTQKKTTQRPSKRSSSAAPVQQKRPAKATQTYNNPNATKQPPRLFVD